MNNLLLALLFAQSADIGSLPWWVGAVLQGGALLLLAYIVIKRDPQQRLNDERERERRDELFEKIVSTIQEKADERQKYAVDTMSAAIRDQTLQLVKEIEASHQRLAAIIGNVIQRSKGNGGN